MVQKVDEVMIYNEVKVKRPDNSEQLRKNSNQERYEII